MATALVTGGTAGIGNAFATQLAARGYDLVLVARDTARMERISTELSQRYGVRVEVLTADLSIREDLLRVRDRVESPDSPIDYLVNNAGFGLHASLLDRDYRIQEKAMDVMCFAVLVLSGAAARAMKARGQGTILNVSSSSGEIMTGNYSAIKAWVTSYTQGLAVEMQDTGVTVTALCPGWVRTEFHERAGIKATNLPNFVWIDKDALVTGALADAEKGKVISVPTVKWKLALLVAKFAPRSFLRWFSGKLSSSRRKP